MSRSLICFENTLPRRFQKSRSVIRFVIAVCHTGCVNTLRTARDRARADVQAQILATARQHLAEHGPAGLSLRAVARDLGLVPSAV